MARIDNGILGGIKGRIGDVEGFIRNGVAFIRKKKRKSKKPASKKQLAARQRMSVVNKFIDTVTPFVAAGFEHVAFGQTFSANNAAKSYQLLNALTGEYPDLVIDYARVKLTKGDLAPAENVGVLVEGNGFRFNWEVLPKMGFYNERSQVMLLVYSPVLNKSFYTMSGARRLSGADWLELPDYFKGLELETYISFTGDDRKRIADSVYAGRVWYLLL